MHVVVLMAGVLDTRRVLSQAVLDAEREFGRGAAAVPRMLSPFDESALETALRLRDADPAVRITALLLEQADDEPLARSVLAHRPDGLLRLDALAVQAWDGVTASAQFASVLAALAEPFDLLLVGREFGDSDDGAFAPALAARLGWRFISQVQALVAGAEGLHWLRERGVFEEWRPVASGTVVSVTNDRRNRLRHPLFKNVAAAKRAPLATKQTPPSPARRALELTASTLASLERRQGHCRMLAGDVATQARALIAHLQSGVRR